jgi:hypothetical protein
MIKETIIEIEARIAKSDTINDENRKELIGLIGVLKSEVAALSKTHADQAESITGFAKVSTHEATREEKNEELLDLSLKGLSSSVAGFETSHPKLVEIVNAMSQILSSMGI